jgi:phenylacetate-CoA ligase
MNVLPEIGLVASLLRHSNARRERMAAFQLKRLRRLVAHAYDAVPYYRDLFDRAGIRPADIRTPADLGAIPITSKKDLQALPASALVARGVDPRRLIERNTSGSSGELFTIRRTWVEERILGILRLRAMAYLGLRPTDRRVSVLMVRAPHPRDHQLAQRLLQRFGWFNILTVDCRQHPDQIARELSRLRPDVITGFAGALWRTAQSLSGGWRGVRPRFVTSGGEVLTPSMRSDISAAFGAPVYDLYGSHEFNVLAWECKESRQYHVCDDGMILEVLNGSGRPVGPGERGEVVGTNLHSFAMPLIRYRLADVVTRGDDVCPCGKPFSTLREIRGRMIDHFPLSDGRLLHPYQIVVPMKEKAPWIRQYQLVQERRDLITLRIVPFTAPAPEQMSAVQETLTGVLGPAVALRVLLVQEIPLEASGKFRVSRSHVASVYDAVATDEILSL